MNFFSKAVAAIGRTAARVAIRFSRAPTYGWPAWTGRSRFDYRSTVGEGEGSSIVMSVLLWICRTFPEAPLEIIKQNQDGTADVLKKHPLTALLDRPNEFYSGPLLWMATLLDYLRGNAYWIKIRSGAGRPVELWYVPSTMIEPRWPDDGSEFISHYDYTPNGVPIRYEVADVVHFRNGMDPQNPRKGLGVLGSLYREIFTDDEAANFSASLLRNLGIPGVVLSPGADDGQIDEPAADLIKGRYKERFNGDNRGEPLVLSSKMDIKVLSFSPEEMNLEVLRRIPEERFCAIQGVSPMVVGLGAGLDRSTYSNMREAKESAWESCLIPIMRLLAAELRTQLLDDFEVDPQISVRFDLSKVRALQADATELFRQATMGMAAGMLTRAQALSHVNMPSLPTDDVYIQSSLLTTVPVGQIAAPEPAAQPAPQPSQLRRVKVGPDLDFKQAFEQLSPTERAMLLAQLAPATNGNGHPVEAG